MSHDWAVQYIDTYKQRQQEKRNKQRRADLAAAGAVGKFHRITKQIQRDIQTFHDAGVLLSVKVIEKSGEGKLTVLGQTSADVNGLEIILNDILINYAHHPPRGEVKRGTLRICADLEGVVKVYKDEGENGGPFRDESEVSEFLLRPFLDEIDE